jgi:hypothetical protein
MLQIIGLIGCLYLLVKGCEFYGNKGYRSEEGLLNGSATIGGLLSVIGSVGFALWLIGQGGAFQSSSSAYDPTINVDANLTTTDNAEADADAALNAAGNDVANADAALNAAK